MSFKIKTISLLLLLTIVVSLAGCAVRIDPPRELTAEEEAKYMGFSKVEHDGEVEVGKYEYLEVKIKLDYANDVTWTSSDPEIVRVDAGGRIDGVKTGEAVVTATARSASVEYPIKVVKAEKTSLSYSTAFTKNEDYIEENKNDPSGNLPYGIIVNEKNNCVSVFTYRAGDNGYDVIVRSMVCSTGVEGKTPNIDRTVTSQAELVQLSDGKYYRYATYVGDDLMFQSSPYSSESADSLVAEEYNKLGTSATAKNIRLSVADAKWIYDNCKEGTRVKIVDSSDTRTYTPLGVPKTMKLTENSASLNWDPTDSTKGNPYIKLKPVISGVEDVAVMIDKGFDLMSGVTAVDTCGNDITAKVKVDGNLNRAKEGDYVVTYLVTDSMGRTARVDRTITVTSDESKIKK